MHPMGDEDFMRSASFPTSFARPPERRAVSTLAHYIAKMALTPRAGAAELANDPRRLRIAITAWLVAGLLSASTLFLAQARGFGTVLMSIIPLPAEQYHFWRALLAIVALMVILAAAAGVAQLSLRLLGPARGTFEDTVSVMALATWLPFVTLWWLPATVLAVSPAGAPFPTWFDAARILAAPLWILAAQVPALRYTHGLSLPRSLLAAGTGLAVAAALFAAFLR
jgi:hypothetical protein